MDFVSDRLVDGRWFRVLTVVDQYTRECLCAHADRSQSGEKVAEQLERVIALRGAPESITSDNGSEFAGQVMDYWAHQVAAKLDFIRPGKPVENSHIESFNGRLRDECLNVEVFLDLADARSKIERWKRDYNQQRPHSSLADRTPQGGHFPSAFPLRKGRRTLSGMQLRARLCLACFTSWFIAPTATCGRAFRVLVTPTTTQRRCQLSIESPNEQPISAVGFAGVRLLEHAWSATFN
jgi:putative transposase